MKTIVKLAALAFLICAPAAMYAQTLYRPIASSLEFSAGSGSHIFTYEGESGYASGLISGGNSSLRFTKWLNSGPLGISVLFDSGSAYSDESEFFGILNHADQAKYLYRYEYDNYNINYSNFAVGVAYRMDYGKWGIIPRLSIGLSDIQHPEYSYQRIPRDGSTGPEYFSYSYTRKEIASDDYLINPSYSYETENHFVALASLQFVYKPSNRVYLFVEPEIMSVPGKLYAECSYYGYKSALTPSNLVESVAYSGLEGSWVIDESTRQKKVQGMHIGPFMNLKFGIGVNFSRRK